MTFQFGFALLLLPAAFLLVQLLTRSRKKKMRSQTYTGPFAFHGTSASAGGGLADVTMWVGLLLLFVALARPQHSFERLPESGEGLDIIITLDVSGSMTQDDYYPSRLAAAKQAALTFIDGRPNDRIGLVIYAEQPRTVCPPTFDHETLQRFVQSAELGNLRDGTAIGAGLAVAAKGFEYSQTERRVIVLISDGEDTSSLVDPITVARAVNTIHGDSLKVYTVAIGTPSREAGLGVDRETLSQIATLNGGMLFDAESPQELDEVYSAIDSLEASTLPSEGLFVYSDSYMPFLLWGILLILVSNVLKWKTYKVVGD